MSSASRECSAAEQLNVHEIEVTVPWGVICAKCWGDPGWKPVLAVHGIQDNAGSFDRLLPLLPRSFYYVCMDLPGHGKSSKMPSGVELNVAMYINAIYRFVRHFHWPEFYYLGHSLGGQIGIYYSLIYPDQVARLITLDTLALFSVRKDDFLDYYRNMTEKITKMEEKLSNDSPPNYTYEEAVERLMKKRPSPLNRAAAEALVKRMLVKGKSGFYFSMDQRLKMGVRFPMTLEQNVANTSKLRCPYLCILTKLLHSACKSENSQGLMKPMLETVEKMKNARIVIVEGFHDVHNNEPETVAPHISDFLLHTKSAL